MKHSSPRALLFFLCSLVAMVFMVTLVAQQTHLLSFTDGNSNEQLMQQCLSRGGSQAQCEQLVARRSGRDGSDNDSTRSAQVRQWCDKSCHGDKLVKAACEKTCQKVNTGKSCRDACKDFARPQVQAACMKKCPGLIMPTTSP